MIDDRAFRIYAARIYLRESAIRRNHPANRTFHWTLFNMAQKARRAATEAREPQGSLFA